MSAALSLGSLAGITSRAISTLAIQDVVRESAQSPFIAEIRRFAVGLDEDDGLKTRCRKRRKSWIEQILISRTLTVCGEVAERLKAAVC